MFSVQCEVWSVGVVAGSVQCNLSSFKVKYLVCFSLPFLNLFSIKGWKNYQGRFFVLFLRVDNQFSSFFELTASSPFSLNLK